MIPISIKTIDRNRLNAYEPLLAKIGFGFSCFFFLFGFLSKAALNVAGGVILLCALIYVALYGRAVVKKVAGLQFLLWPLLAGVVAALFSNDGGAMASLEYLNSMKFLFVPFFLGVFVRSRKQLYIIVACLVISGLLATLYGFWHSSQLEFGMFKGYFKLDRSASLFLTVCLALVVILLEGWRDIPVRWRWVLLGLAVLFHWELVMCAIRAAWLGYVVGIGLFLFAARSKMAFGFLGLLVLGAVLVGASDNPVRQEVVSIANLKTDQSNSARLHLWHVGMEFSREQLFFGTGVKGVKKQYADFFARQSDDYRQRYHFAGDYHADFHNNYLQILVESGLLTLVSMLIGFGALAWSLVRRSRSLSGLERAITLAAFAVLCGFLAKQFFHFQLTSYGSVGFYLVLFCGMSFSALKRREDDSEGEERGGVRSVFYRADKAGMYCQQRENLT